MASCFIDILQLRGTRHLGLTELGDAIYGNFHWLDYHLSTCSASILQAFKAFLIYALLTVLRKSP